ncbi:MAG: glutathione S-transferase C-terminal domain-containing protein [Pseudomonadota bacterium]|nr:glutathione S-transferase C-terminal domain-containing protein [Pseudomonadota bacterium]
MISECFNHLRGPVGKFSRPLFRGKSAEFEEPIQETAAAVQNELTLLESRLTDAEWLAGQTISAADLIVYPVLMQFTRAARLKNAAWLNLPNPTLNADYPALALWQTPIEAIPD